MLAVEQLEWLTPARLVVAGGFDAAAAEYVIVEAATGKELGAHFVGGLAWSPSPHIAYEYFRPPVLCVDDECLPGGPGGYPAKEGRLHFYWGPVWSLDASHFAILAREPQVADKHIVVFKKMGGGFREIPLPFPYESYYQLFWDGPDLILISTRIAGSSTPNTLSSFPSASRAPYSTCSVADSRFNSTTRAFPSTVTRCVPKYAFTAALPDASAVPDHRVHHSPFVSLR
jgi:hypothetical protein